MSFPNNISVCEFVCACIYVWWYTDHHAYSICSISWCLQLVNCIALSSFARICGDLLISLRHKAMNDAIGHILWINEAVYISCYPSTLLNKSGILIGIMTLFACKWMPLFPSVFTGLSDPDVCFFHHPASVSAGYWNKQGLNLALFC